MIIKKRRNRQERIEKKKEVEKKRTLKSQNHTICTKSHNPSKYQKITLTQNHKITPSHHQKIKKKV